MDFRDDLYFLVFTVEQEAGWEPYEGQLAVAYVVMNRAKIAKSSVLDVILKPMQFSCWNADSPTRMNIDTIPNDILKNCYKASCGAYFELSEDPSKDATHYLNEEATRKERGGTLPNWFDESKITARIGHHTFLKLG